MKGLRTSPPSGRGTRAARTRTLSTTIKPCGRGGHLGTDAKRMRNAPSPRRSRPRRAHSNTIAAATRSEGVSCGVFVMGWGGFFLGGGGGGIRESQTGYPSPRVPSAGNVGRHERTSSHVSSSRHSWPSRKPPTAALAAPFHRQLHGFFKDMPRDQPRAQLIVIVHSTTTVASQRRETSADRPSRALSGLEGHPTHDGRSLGQHREGGQDEMKSSPRSTSPVKRDRRGLRMGMALRKITLKSDAMPFIASSAAHDDAENPFGQRPKPSVPPGPKSFRARRGCLQNGRSVLR